MHQDNPLISLVVPCYKVAPYLPAFLRSLDEQLDSFEDFEVIFVIDGCPEGSGEVVEAWQGSSNVRSTLIATQNQGVSKARNTGLAVALGAWVSFPDPDDEISVTYLAEVFGAIQKPGNPELLLTRMLRTNEDVTLWHRHALEYRYNQGSRDLDLVEEPQMLQLSAGTAFFRRELIEQNQLEFDSRLKVFEDGKFVAEYMLSCPSMSVRMCSSAVYFYKTRPDNSGALASSANNFAERFRISFQYAYPELLAKAADKAPVWLEYVILYDLYWLFVGFLRANHPIFAASQESLAELSDLARDLLRQISVDAIQTFNAVRVEPEIRAAWLSARLGEAMPKYVRQYRTDNYRNETEYRYLVASVESGEQIWVDGVEEKPTHAKWRAVTLFGQVWLYERILWVKTGDTRFAKGRLEGDDGEFAFGGVPQSEQELFVQMNWNRVAPVAKDWTLFPNDSFLRKAKRSWEWSKARMRRTWGLAARKLAVLPIISSRYRNAWLIMDRDSQANDNGEALVRHLHEHEPATNAWFVVRKSSPDYRRLREEGIPVLPYLGVRHFIALRNCSHLLSSHIDQYVVRPFRKYGLPKTWNYVFLQHGVTKDALERWLNTKDVQLLVSSTVDEAHAFEDDGSPYIFTDKEVLLSEMPRHDQFHAALEANAGTRDEIVISPTWRKFLLSEAVTTGNERSALEVFASSAYVEEWSQLLESPALQTLAQKHGKKLVLLPHPNLEPHIQHMRVPGWVAVRSYGAGDASRTLANASLMITDYSSIAFDAAYCRTPSVYFQFDATEFFAGGHIASKGYFDYRENGFGPVTEDLESTLEAIANMLDRAKGAELYFQRIDELFPYRDGGASERIVEAVGQLGDRY